VRKKLLRHLKGLREREPPVTFWSGFGSVLDIGGSYFRPVYDPHDGQPSAIDALSVQSDWAVIGQELRRLSAE
jgi:hypothetical protein